MAYIQEKLKLKTFIQQKFSDKISQVIFCSSDSLWYLNSAQIPCVPYTLTLTPQCPRHGSRFKSQKRFLCVFLDHSRLGRAISTSLTLNRTATVIRRGFHHFFLKTTKKTMGSISEFRLFTTNSIANISSSD